MFSGLLLCITFLLIGLSMHTSVGQVLINEALPEKLRDYNRIIDKKSMAALLTTVLEEYGPDVYHETIKKLYATGSELVKSTPSSFSLKDLRTPPKTEAMLQMLRTKLNDVITDPAIDPKTRDAIIIDVVGKAIPDVEKQLVSEAIEDNNAFARQVVSGARGDVGALRSLLVGSLLTMDHKDRPIPVPVWNSLAKGNDPVEYWANAYGARRGQIATKLSTAKAGFFGKQLAMAAHREVVTSNDCGTVRAIPAELDDNDNIGCVLNRDYGDIKAGTVITPGVMKRLRSEVEDPYILVRSPVTCEAENGICSKCAGVRERGRLPEIGENIGIAAAQALSEPLSQGLLRAKHCLSEHEKVRMADWSIKRMKDINVGDRVMGVDSDGNCVSTKVKAVYNNGVKDVYRTCFKRTQNESITADSTLEHKLLAIRMATGCSNEKYNDVPRMLPIGKVGRDFYSITPWGCFDDTQGVYADEPFALLCGLLLGDGCYTKAVDSVNFSCADKLLITDLSLYLQTLGLKLSKLGNPYYYKVSMIKDYNKGERTARGQFTKGSRNLAKIFLQKNNMYGKYAHEKEIPECAYHWSNKSIADLIAGLIITDGCIHRSLKSKLGVAISFTSCSYRLIEQVRELLAWRFCIYVPPIMTKKLTGLHKHTPYAFAISQREDVLKFYKYIPLLGVKKERLSAYISEAPLQRYTRRYRRALRITQEFVGAYPTMDIEVELDTHRFLLANGIIVSNSAGRVGSTQGEMGAFEFINQLIQVPDKFREGAVVSSVDGSVSSIEDAPQGGKFITVAGEKHHVPDGFELKVKIGDDVDAGDLLTSGVPNPSDIVQYKGIGAGRQAFINALRNAYSDSGMKVNRRNIEVLARGLVNHVKVTGLDGPQGSVPGDIVEYNSVERSYRPRSDSAVVGVDAARNKYLEQPLLYYSVGTRLTPKVINDLKKYKINELTVNDNPPAFEPFMVRAMAQASVSPDWQVRLGGSYLERGMLEAVQRGRASNISGTSYIPALARGVGFGDKLKDKGFY